jgi:NAD(P)H-dependent flavin oxidoreductase YrpB (nitropropane dioxygenase family)
MRVLKNLAVEMIQNPDKTMEDKRLNSASADIKYIQSGGDADTAIMPAGQIAGLIKQIESIGKIFPELMKGAILLAQQLKSTFGGE